MSETTFPSDENPVKQPQQTSNNKTPKSITILYWPQCLIFLVFLACKLEISIFAGTEIANWSWWWVTCPLWCVLGIFVAMLAIGLVFVIGALAVIGISSLFDNK